MSDFSITCDDFEEGEEIPKKFGYKFENENTIITMHDIPTGTKCTALIMDDPDAMGAVGKIWVHWLTFCNYDYDSHDETRILTQELVEKFKTNSMALDAYTVIDGKNDFGEIGYGGPAPPDKRHTYIFKCYALDTELNLKEGFSKEELEDAMKGHILAEAKLTGTFAP